MQLALLIQQNSFDGGAALNDSSSPQYASYQWLVNDPLLALYDEARRLQRYAMGTIYFSMGGNSWIDNDDWLSLKHECDWFSRVRRGLCGPPGDRRMRRLVLYYNNLQGTIPNEIDLLTDLREINLMVRLQERACMRCLAAIYFSHFPMIDREGLTGT